MESKEKIIYVQEQFGTISAILFTVIFFYTYSGILGRLISWVNIVSFFLAIILGEYISYRIMISNFKCDKDIAITIWIIIFTLFIAFNFYPPQIALFIDPTIEGWYVECSEDLFF